MLIVFDFDGTLMDTLRDLAEAASDLAESYGHPRLSEAQAAAMIGDGAALFVERVLAASGMTAPPEALDRYLAFYEARAFDHTVPYPGAPEMLERLSAGHRLALLTNKPGTSARALMRHAGIDRWLGACVFGDGPLPRKPDPAGLGWLMAQAGADPRHTVMVGDSIMDVEAARAAGTHLAVARYGFGYARIPAGRLLPGDLIVETPLALVPGIDALAAAVGEEAR